MSVSKSEKERLERSLFEDPLLQTLSNYKDPNTRRRDDTATTQDSLDSKIQDVNSDLLTKASMTLPMKWDGNSLTVEKNIRTSIACGIPASVNNGRWSTTVSGSSIVRGPMGCASGAMNLTYHPSILKGSQLHGGLQVGDQANLSVGGLIRRNKSSVGISVVSRRRSSSLTATLSAQHKFKPCLINSRVTLGPKSPIWDVSVSPSLTIHKLQLGVGWNRSQPCFHMTLLCPKISLHRRANLTIHWRPASGWKVGATLAQSLASKVASLGIGIRLCGKQLEWIFTWNRGDVTVGIPIIITQYQNVWMNCLQVAYLSVVSQVIQDAVADLWNLNSSPKENEALRKEQERMKRAKARTDAEQQKQLMMKQAQSRAKAEQAKQGLVIRQATYQVPGGDSWDVTAQLQFWTENSSLELPSSSKKDLLGFYNVASSIEDKGSDVGLWEQLWGMPKAEDKKPTPTLAVQYYYAKRLYEITISDDEPLVLPSSKAVPATE